MDPCKHVKNSDIHIYSDKMEMKHKIKALVIPTVLN